MSQHGLSKLLGIFAVNLLLFPGLAHAQSAIAGVVRDTSGAVLPGVNVEASSEVLIEKTRSVVTDGAGQYKIVDLRPGTYIVTFTLQGFATIKRENVQLPAEFTSTINADMKVGAIEESVTVSAESPVVDVTTAVHTQVLSREAIDSIPTGRTIQGMGQLIVGISLNLPDTGGARAMQQTYMSTHGMTTSNTTVLVDGMMVNGLQSDGAVQSYFNDAMNQEVSYQTSGIGADTQAGGVRLNMIPREGGNRFSGDFKTAYRPGAWQGDNLTQRHIDKGLQTGNATDRIVDFTAAQGGPIRKDKLWFFGSARYISVNNFIPDTFYDDGSKGVDDQFIKSGLVRLTWQVSPRNKFSVYFDEVDKFRGHDMQALFDPKTAATVWYSPAYHTSSAKWTSAVTNRLLIEGGWSNNTENYTNSYLPGIDQLRGTSSWLAAATRSELDLGGRKTAATSQTTQSPIRFAVNASASYVTGSHNLKIGFQRTWGTFFHTVDANADLTQQYRSNSTGIPFTVPDTVIIRNTPLAKYGERLNQDLGIYAQDSWKMNRLTINAGIRYEWLNAQVEPAVAPAGRFVPERRFDGIKNLPDWQNMAPRFAAVYDLFGNARTAIKYSLNKYNQARTTGIAADYNPLVSLGATTATSPALAWRDVNGDDIAQGDRGCNFGTNGLPGCEINFSALPSNFGVVALNTYGNYPRTWNLEHGLELQHELLPRLSVSVAWFHGDFHNLTTTVNQSWKFDGNPLQNPNYIPFPVYNPLTGEPITVYGRTAAAANAPTLNLDTFDPNRKRIYDAYGMDFRARPGRGANLFGGFGFERQLDVNCTAPDNPNSVYVSSTQRDDFRFCDDRKNGIPFRRQFKLAGSFPLPGSVMLSASYQNVQGSTSSQNMAITRNSTRYPASCPAPCPAGAIILPASFQPSTLTVQLVDQDTVYTERINQLDLRVSRTFKVGRVSVSPTLEAFNVNNSDAVVSYVSTNVLAASYLRPNSILQGRIIGVGTNVRW
jgi:Carboxypeptidase regulatory-like domain